MAVACLVGRPHAFPNRGAAAFLLGLLALLLGAAILSAIVHPSAQARPVIATLAACAALSMLLAMGPSRPVMPALLGVATVTALGVLGWVVLYAPELLGTKFPAARLLGGSPGLSHLPAAHPNVAAVLAAIAVPGWLALATRAPRGGGRGVSTAMLVLSLAIVVVSGSRAGALAATIGALLVAWLQWRRSREMLLGATALVLLASPVWAPGIVRLLTLGSGNDQARLPVWEASLRGIGQSPWLGRGIGSFPFAYARIPNADPVAIGTHNTYLQAWLDFGLLGMVATVGLAVFLLVVCMRAPARDPTALALKGVAAAWLVMSLFESTVIMTSRTARPWADFREVVVPLAFVIFGLAAAPGLVMASDPSGHSSAAGRRQSSVPEIRPRLDAQP
jgi:O-antigen ligase